MSRLAPRLTTDRLVLRGYRQEDFDWFDATWREPNVVRFTGGHFRNRIENWPRFLLNFGMWELFGFGFWLIEDRATGERLGIAGLMHAVRDIPSIDGKVEASWVLASSAFGRGLATEAMVAILAWTDTHVEAPGTVCIIDPDNQASIRVARKSGYARSGLVAFEGGKIVTYFRPRSA